MVYLGQAIFFWISFFFLGGGDFVVHRTFLFQKNCVSYLCHRTNAIDKIINFIYNFALLLRVPFKAFGTCLQMTIKTVVCFSVHCRIVNFEFTYMRIW